MKGAYNVHVIMSIKVRRPWDEGVPYKMVSYGGRQSENTKELLIDVARYGLPNWN